jgi:ABC-type Fe3+/spermidine/putrescine transport system ATPase subunit
VSSAFPAERRESASASAVVDIRALIKRYGHQTVLDGCSLTAAEGEILTLLGPSGCGKTTLLRCVAGFITPDGGSMSVDGADMGPVPVNRRPVGVVFQSYALFPHLTVARNVGYGLRMRGLPAREITGRVEAALASVSLTGLQDRYPSQLSGGQQQRVAIARVVVLQPRVLLLDEPFNALDAKLRGAMQVELRQLIKRLGITAIFVTHDQEEAMTLSDRIAVMRAGRIEQVDRPEAVYDRPATMYVADFIGASNIFASRAMGGRLALPDGQSVATVLDGGVKVMVRPHNLALARMGNGTGGSWRGQLRFRRHVGAMMEYEVVLHDGQVVKAVGLHGEQVKEPEPGESVTLTIRNPAACMVFATP